MKISAYTTTYNCQEMDYPIRECIQSLATFADEICIADAGSLDGTIDLIREVSQRVKCPVRVVYSPVNFDKAGWSIEIDGHLKAKAKSGCTGDVVWQVDNDQIFSEQHSDAARAVSEYVLENKVVMSIGQVEFWGNLDTCREDVGPKPMVYPNLPNLTHGIRKDARRIAQDGRTYSQPFMSDSCDIIDEETKTLVTSPYAVKEPWVYHVSWLNFRRKLEHYKEFWHKFHIDMHNLDPDHNAMFQKPWSEVTPKDLDQMEKNLEKMGPRIFHRYQSTWSGRTRKLTEAEKTYMPQCLLNL